jgi:predicted transcriptional regulator of viral defense system
VSGLTDFQVDVTRLFFSIATPAVTVFDLVEAPASGGRPGNVATVIGELLQDGTIDGEALADVAAHYPTAVMQRTGHLVEHMAENAGATLDLSRLEQLVIDAANTLLDPRGPHHGRRDRRWHLLANTDIEHDL